MKKKTMRKITSALVFGLLSMAFVIGAAAEETVTHLDSAPTVTDETVNVSEGETGDTDTATSNMDGANDVPGGGNMENGDNDPGKAPEGKSSLKIAEVVRRKATEQYPAYGSLEKLNLGENFAVTVTDEEGTVLTEDDYVLSWTLKDPAVENVDEEPSLRIGENTVYIKVSPKAGNRYTSAVSEPQTLEIVPRQFVASLKLNYTFEKEDERQYFSDNYSIEGLDKSAYSVYFKCANGEGSTLMIPSTPGIYRVEAQVSNVSGYTEGTYTLVNWHWDNVRVYKAASAILPSSAATITLPYVEGGYTPSGIIGVSASVPGLDASLYTVEYQEASGKTIKEIGDYLVRVKVYLNDNSEYYLLEGVTETTVPVSIIRTGMLVDVEQKLTQANSYDVTTPADVAKVSVRANVSGTPLLKEGEDYQVIYTIDGKEVPASTEITEVGKHIIGVNVSSLKPEYSISEAGGIKTFDFEVKRNQLKVTYTIPKGENAIYCAGFGYSADELIVPSVKEETVNGDVNSVGQVTFSYSLTKKDSADKLQKAMDAGTYIVSVKPSVSNLSQYEIVEGKDGFEFNFVINKSNIEVSYSFEPTEAVYDPKKTYTPEELISVTVEMDRNPLTQEEYEDLIVVKRSIEGETDENGHAKEVGKYNLKASADLIDKENYALKGTEGSNSFEIKQRHLTISYEYTDKEIYDRNVYYSAENLIRPVVKDGEITLQDYSSLVFFNYFLNNQEDNKAHDVGSYSLKAVATLEDSKNYALDIDPTDNGASFTIVPRNLTLKAYALNDENSNSWSVTYEEGAKHTMTDYFGATLTDNDNNGNEVTDCVVNYGSDVELSAKPGQATKYTRTASVTKAYGEEIKNNYKINTCELLFVVEPKEVRVEIGEKKTKFVYRPEGYMLTEYFPVTVKFTKEDGREETLTRDAENGYTLTYEFIDSPAVEIKDEKLTDRGTYQIRPTVQLTGKYATGEKGNYSIQQIEEPTEFTVKPREVGVTYPVSQTWFKYRVSGYELKDILLVQVDILDDEGKSAIQTLEQENGDYTVEYVYTYTNQKKEEIEKNDKTVIDDAGIYKTTTHVKLAGQNNEYASTNKDGECNYVFKGTKQNVSENDVDLTVTPYELSWTVEANGDITTGENQFTYRSAKATGKAAGIPMSNALKVAITGFDGAGVTEAPECTIEYEITYDEDGAMIGEEVWKQAGEALMVDAREYHVAIRANLSEPEDQNNYTIEKTTIDLEVVKRQVQATQYYKVNGEKSETAEKLWYRPGENGAHEIADYIGVVVKTVPFNNDELDKYYGDYNLDMVNAEEVEEYTDTYSVKYDYVGKEPEDPESIQNAGDYVIHEEFEYNTQNYALDNESNDENGDGTLTLTVQPRVIEVSHTSTGFVYNQKEHALADQITLSAKSVKIEGYPEAYYPEVTMDDAAFKAIIAQLTYLAEGQDTFGQNLLDEEGNAKQFTAIEEAGTYEAWEEITLSDPNYELVNKTKENRTTIRVDKATIRSADNEATKEIVYNGQDRLLNAGESELTSEKVVASAEGCENRVPASEYRLISDRTLNTIGEYTLSLQLTEECNNYRLADGGVSVKQYVLPHPAAALALTGGVNSDERGVYLFGGENPGVNHVVTLTGEPGESVDIILTNGTETLCETSLVLDGTRFANGDAKAEQTASISFQFADTTDNGAVLTIGDKRIAIANNGRYELRVNYTDEENLTEQAAGQDAPKPVPATMGYMWDKTKPEVSLQSELHNRDRQTTVIVSEACTLESFKVNDVERITNSDMEFGAQGEREYTLTWSMDTLMHSGTDALAIQSVDLVGNTNTQTFDVERSEGAPLTLTIQPVVNDNGYVDRSEVQVDYVAIFVEGTAGELIQIEQNGAMMTSTSGIKLPMLSRSGTEWAVDKMGGYSGQYSPDSFPNFEQFLLSTCYEDLDAPQADITLIYDDVCLPTVVASAVTEDCRVISCLAERGSYLSFYRNGEPINVQGRIDNYGVFVGSMPYLEKDDVLRIIAVDLAGNIDRKEIVVGEEVSSVQLDGYLMGRTAIGYVSGNEEMDWVTASYLRIDELKEGVTLPLVAANAFIYGEAEVRMDEDGRVTVETVLNDGVKAENDYVGVLTEYDMDSFKNRKAGSVVTNPNKIRDGVWVCFSQNVELSAAQMTESYLIWRNTSDEDYLLYLNRQRSAELSTLIF